MNCPTEALKNMPPPVQTVLPQSSASGNPSQPAAPAMSPQQYGDMLQQMYGHNQQPQELFQNQGAPRLVPDMFGTSGLFVPAGMMGKQISPPMFTGRQISPPFLSPSFLLPSYSQTNSLPAFSGLPSGLYMLFLVLHQHVQTCSCRYAGSSNLF